MTPVREAIIAGLIQSGHLDDVPPSRLRVVAEYVQDSLEVRLPQSEGGVAWARSIGIIEDTP